VADDGNVVAGGTAERTTVGGLLLNVGEDGTFGDRVEGQDVADGERGVLSGVDELDAVSTVLLLVRHSALTDLASVHALVGDEGLGVVLEPVWVAESDAGKRSACGILSVKCHMSQSAG
jgi:hypothetical protein